LKTGRVFHVWDLPIGLVWIDLGDNFRKNLIDKAKEVIGGESKLAQYLGIPKHNLFNWRKGRSYWKNIITRRSIPLSHILKLCELINNPGFSKEELERNVISIKGPGSGRSIKTKFPWYEDERIVRIVFHLLADGFGSSYGRINEDGKFGGNPYYRNTRSELRSEFKEDLEFFGDVPINLNTDMVVFPKVISYILKYFYKIEFGTHTGEIPKVMFDLPKEVIAQGIKSFNDDEGGFDDTRVKISSFNKKMLSQFRVLIIKKFPEMKLGIGEIKLCKTMLRNKLYTGYNFAINSQSLEEYYEKIGFLHKRKKELLDQWIQRKDRGWIRRTKGLTKLLILNELIEKPKTSTEISNNIGVTSNSVRCHFKGNRSGTTSLEKEGLIRKIEKNRWGGGIWQITEKGKKSLANI
tara:strand:+ start:60 stop:1283 length:1224 start_codon:yes stop_codon:yes gene_type:complete